MINRNQFIISFCTIVAFAILYEHQPLLPLLAKQWHRSASEVAFVTALTMLPLAVAPLIYGYFLEQISSRRLLLSGFTVLLISQAILSTGPDYPVFLLLRAIEGLMLPALFTSLMTYMSVIGGQEKARRNISLYIASTIVGGYCGRVITGIVTGLSDWQTAFWMWSVLALVAVLLLLKLEADPRSTLVKVSFSEISSLLKKSHNRYALLGAFLIMFVFAGVLNFLPFRLTELDPTINTALLSLVYSGYLIGVMVSLFSTRLIGYFGSERSSLLAGACIFLFGTLLFFLDSITLLYLAMLVFAAGMFTMHSIFSGYLNHLETSRKGMINGLYVSFYYSGGALGSYLPGLLYQSAGWLVFCLLMLLLVLLLIVLIYSMPTQ